jgi:hypothetical protein
MLKVKNSEENLKDDLLVLSAEVSCLFSDLGPIVNKLENLVKNYDSKKFDIKKFKTLANAGVFQINYHQNNIKKILKNHSDLKEKITDSDWETIYNNKQTLRQLSKL